MSTPVHEKIKLIRESERLNRKEISQLTGIAYGSFCGYEAGDKKPGVEAIMRLLQHPKFMKYTLWFMTDQVSPEAGQIAPALAHFGQDLTTSQHSDQKTGQQLTSPTYISNVYYWSKSIHHIIATR